MPDLVSALLESLLRGAPTEAHMTGLVACAIAWLTTEDLLREVVGADAPAVWAWLERRPFVVGGPHGLWPHDLARDVLDAEFERRSPERYRALHRVVHDHVVAGLRAATGPDRQLLAQHLLYLHRKSPLTAAFYALRAQGSAAVVPARPEEHDQVLAIIEGFEGPAAPSSPRPGSPSSPTRSAWCATDEGVGGFAYHVLHPTGSALEDRDPVVRAVLDHVAPQGPVRPGERVNIVRFFGGRARAPARPVRRAGRAGVVAGRVGDPPARLVVRRRHRHRVLGAVLRLPGVRPAAGDRGRRPSVRRLRLDWRRIPVDRGST